MYSHIHCGDIHNNQGSKQTYVSTAKYVDKGNVADRHNRILISPYRRKFCDLKHEEAYRASFPVNKADTEKQMSWELHVESKKLNSQNGCDQGLGR